jgi:hypothetical protein
MEPEIFFANGFYVLPDGQMVDESSFIEGAQSLDSIEPQEAQSSII